LKNEKDGNVCECIVNVCECMLFRVLFYCEKKKEERRGRELESVKKRDERLDG
jgi:hypothetical protein